MTSKSLERDSNILANVRKYVTQTVHSLIMLERHWTRCVAPGVHLPGPTVFSGLKSLDPSSNDSSKSPRLWAHPDPHLLLSV